MWYFNQKKQIKFRANEGKVRPSTEYEKNETSQTLWYVYKLIGRHWMMDGSNMLREQHTLSSSSFFASGTNWEGARAVRHT